MNPLVLAFLISSGVAFYGGWTLNQAVHDENEKHSIEAAAAQERELHAREQKRGNAALVAQVVARQSEARLRSDVAASQSELERLRDTSTGALRATAGSLAACVAISATYDELLLDLSSRYRTCALKADEHIIDLRTQLDTP